MLTRMFFVLFLAIAANFSLPALAQEIPLKSGEKIAFMGDSITAAGMGSPIGYCRLVISGLEVNGISVTPIAAGVGGHKSNNMLERLEKDVISKKPDWMTLSCGVNDVWHGEKGVPLDAYKKNITDIVDQALAAGIKVMLLTATMIGEDPGNPNNQKLVAYNDFIRELAKEKKCLLADLNAAMQEQLKTMGANGKANLLTSDGVHMNPEGNIMMALGVLRSFGLNQEQLEKAQTKWLESPDAVEVGGKIKISVRQFRQLSAHAARQNRSVTEILNEALNKTVEGILAQPQP